MTVLIVDDDAQYREMLREALADYGCEADAPETLGSALRILDQGCVDAVLCGGLDGLWVKVFSEAVKSGSSFVLLSGNEAYVRQAENLGARVCSKPYSVREILCELRWPMGPEAIADATGEP
jgi:DNA-binding response OmpR family regulator